MRTPAGSLDRPQLKRPTGAPVRPLLFHSCRGATYDILRNVCGAIEL
jgi:hypothetical protein